MKARQWITVSGLLVLILAAIVGVFMTEGAQTVLLSRSTKTAKQPALVDQRPLQTARKLAALASTGEERDLAHEALRLADYEVDLALADALREAKEHPPELTAEQRELMARNFKAETVVKTDQELITRLTRQLAATPESNKDEVQDQLDVAKAQMELDQDELDDAKQDMLRAGGNPQGKIQQLLQEHDAVAHTDATSANASSNSDNEYQAHNLFPQVRAWLALREKSSLLAQARQEALDEIPVLTRAHETFDQRVRSRSNKSKSSRRKPPASPEAKRPADGASKKQAAKDALDALRHLSADQKAVSDLDKRIQDQTELAEVYANWGNHGRGQAAGRSAWHVVVGLWIFLILIAVYLVGRLIDRYFIELSADKRRLVTLAGGCLVRRSGSWVCF